MLSTVSRAVGIGSLAWDAWKSRPGADETTRRAASRHLAQKLGRMRGLPQKVGQMLAFGVDGPSEFSELYEQAQPLPWSAFHGTLSEEWGCSPADVLMEVDPTGKAASLGQVHRARLRDGREVAVKIQYPGIGEACQTDLSLLGWLSAPLGGLNRGFDLADYRQTLLEDLDAELDYRGEADRQREFHRWAEASSFLVVPSVVDEWSTARVLVTLWHDGATWDDVRNHWSPAKAGPWCRQFVGWFFEGLLQRGLAHADLHPGNIRFLDDGPAPRALLYDFGCVARLSDAERAAFARLIRATQTRGESPYPLFLALGFSPKWLAPIAERLPAVCDALFEPLRSDAPMRLSEWDLATKLSDTLGDDRWNFRIAGPARLLPLLRAWHGLNTYVRGFDQAIPWKALVEPHLAAALRETPMLHSTLECAPAPDFGAIATTLRVQVSRDGETRVQLKLPKDSVDRLGDLIDDEVAARLTARGLSVEQLIAETRRRGYAPGPIFTLQEDAREYRVWLE